MAKSEWLKKYKYRNYARGQDKELFLRAFKKTKFANIKQFLYACRNNNEINLKRSLLSIWFNIHMRIFYWREYEMPLYLVLIYPIIAMLRLLSYCYAAVRGHSVYWANIQKIENNIYVERDQEWIYQCLNNDS